MLQRAAAADPEMRAFRRDAVGRRLENFQQLGLIVLTMAPSPFEPDPLARQGARDKRRLAFPDDAFCVVSQCGDGCDFLNIRDDPAAPQAGFSHACRNSTKCGWSVPARNSVFTRSTSSA